jgi:hypothetical protein
MIPRGIMHESRAGSSAFVFDMMEPERPKVDRSILEFVKSHKFHAADFVIRSGEAGGGGCLRDKFETADPIAERRVSDYESVCDADEANRSSSGLEARIQC